MRPLPRHLRGKTVAVIGLGQIGGSILKCLATRRSSITLLAHDRRGSLRARATRFARWSVSVTSAVSESDLLILCVPVPEIISMIGDIARATTIRNRSSKLLVLDVGTVKAPILSAASRHRRRFDFVGLHPLAGSEGTGWASSDPGLFLTRPIVYCARQQSRVGLARELIRLLGATPLPLSAATHDRLCAEAIALPHLLAFAAQGVGRGMNNALRAGSWESLTRVAASNPEMVSGFLWNNAREVKNALARFRRELDALVATLEGPDPRQLTSALRRRRKRAP